MPLPHSRKRSHPPDDSGPGDDSSSSSNVKVVVRIRPPNVKEIEGNFREVVQAVDENVLVFDPKEPKVYEYGRRRPQRDIRQRRNKDLKFAFDHVFGPSSTNVDVYRETTNTVLTGLLNGYNCSVFAYGATGAGKTHTMLGSQEHPGVMYHTMTDLYSRIDSMRDTKTCDVAVSYLEIYNETIRDLLMPGAALPIREDPGKGVVVQGLSLHKPKTAEELLYMLQYGNQHRTQHPTDANAESSRSHAVLQVFVRQQDRTANISAEVRIAKLCLVDLAGSERATVTKNRGSRFREGANINRSLLALGNVINALAENKNKGFIPYRDSKLTRLLKDSLGGNCQTVMIAAVSPSAMSYEDTYNTLRYADRAKHIKATLKKNVLNVDYHVAKYGKIVEELRKEIVELKGKLKTYEEGIMAPAQGPATDMNTCPSSFIGYQNELSRFFVGHQSLRSDQLQQEITLRNLQWKMYRKQRCLSRLEAVNEPANEESQKKIESLVNGMNQKTSCLKITSESSRGKVAESCKHLAELEQSIRASCGAGDGPLPEVLALGLQVHGLSSDLQDVRQHLAYTKQVVRHQEKELHLNERLIHMMLKLLKRQHYIIKGHNMLTSDLLEEYLGIQQLVAGQEISWGDQPETTCYTRGYTLMDMLELPSLALKSEDYKSEVSVKTTSTAAAVFEFKATRNSQQEKVPASYPYKVVDECSPPKAKRAMLEAPKSQQPPSRVERNGRQIHPQRNIRKGFTPVKSRSTPTKSKSTPTKSVSFSEVPSKFGKTEGLNKKLSQSMVDEYASRTRKVPQRSASVGSNVDFDNEDDSSELEKLKNSKFAKVNDTITKCKKFSHLHLKDCSSKLSSAAGATIQEETPAELDGTFTIDPGVNSTPVSKIPCIDCAENQSCRKCENSLTGSQSSVIATESVNKPQVCQNCGKDKDIKIHKADRRLSNTNFLGISFANNLQTESADCKCANLGVVPAQVYTSCLENPHSGTQNDYGPENESGTSTIVNQSSNSVTSLASVSTLIEGQNLSQNLSQTDESELVDNGRVSSVNSSKDETSLNASHDKAVNSLSVTKSSQMPGVTDVTKHINSATVTKSIDAFGATVTKDTSLLRLASGEKCVKAARSIKFDNDENQQTPVRGKSYADIVRTPTPERQPLRQLDIGNTPLSSPRCDSRSSFTSSDSDMSFDKRTLKEGQTGRAPSSSEMKETKRILNQYGLPSVVESSLIIKNTGTCKPQLKKNQSLTPGYMQTTKSHMNRKRLNVARNTSLNSSSEDTLKSESVGDKLKSSFISKHGRSLSSHKRSKSVSNLSSRASWQI